MKISKYFLVSISLLFIFAKCEKDPPLDTNSPYIRCKVNGQTYIPENCANCMQCDLIGDTTLIFGANRGYETLGFGIKDLSNIKVGTYPLNESLFHRGDYDNSPTVGDGFFTTATHTGQATITKIDRTNRIMEGNFSFTAYSAVYGTTVNVTDGIFKLRF